ncbi:unnamed protein product, partial [Durusdinium trenchii]
ARLQLLRPELPIKCRVASSWRLLYRPEVHGVSMGTFFRQCQVSREASPSETLILVEDTEGAVFGGFASHTWHVAQRHFGHADCFVFRFEEDLQVHRWAGLNSYFLFADASGLKLGGGRHPALWIDRDFLRGASGPCETFGTAGALHGVVPELSGDFVVKTFECWGFDCLDPPKEDTGWERRQAGAWQACRSYQHLLRGA